MSWIQSDLQKSEPYVPPTWADGTDEEIVSALEAHYAGEIDLTQYWSVGDTRQVILSSMSAIEVSESHTQQTVTFVLSNVGGKTLSDGTTTCAFQVDQVNSLNEVGHMNDSNYNTGGWKNSKRRTWCNSIYKNAIPSTLRGIFKEFINQSGKGGGASGVENTMDYFALRAEIEVFGSCSYSVSGEGSQVDWYKTSSNKIKKVNSSNEIWWERSPYAYGDYYFCYVDTGGNTGYYPAHIQYGIAPFGVI